MKSKVVITDKGETSEAMPVRRHKAPPLALRAPASPMLRFSASIRSTTLPPVGRSVSFATIV